MKDRLLTAGMIFVALMFVFLMREYTLYVFDAFIVVLSVLGARESSKLFAKMGYYNSDMVASVYPVAFYSVLLTTFLTGLTFVYALMWQLILIIMFLLTTFFVFYFSKAYTQNEIKTRKYKGTYLRFVFTKTVHTLFAMVYPSLLFMAFVFLNHFATLGIVTALGVDVNLLSLILLLVAFLIPILTDTFSMLVGSLVGGKKLAPKISPNKTISGAVGGFVFTVLLMVGLFLVISSGASVEALFCELGISVWHILGLSVLGNIVCNLGDLFESYLKRRANVKDSSNILPGHGGILDRMDSHGFNALLVLLFFIIIL